MLLKLRALFIVLTASSVLCQLQCNPANETLLQISTKSGENFDKITVDAVYPTSFITKFSLGSAFSNAASLETCIPSNECVVANVALVNQNRDLNTIEVTNDGTTLEMTQAHNYFSSPGGSYFINCEPPKCADGETPLEMSIVTESADDITWRIEDLEGNVLFEYCQEGTDCLEGYRLYSFFQATHLPSSL